MERRILSTLDFDGKGEKVAAGYRLGGWTVRPHRNRIERGCESIHLAPKAMAVLDRLVEASNSVVTRQEIFDSVWRGAVVSDEALTQRIAEIRKAFGDSAHRSNIIETIPKIGFRLIPPATPIPGEFGTGTVNPVIAVLPFLNMSEDPANEYFSDGISEELINLFAKVPGLDVISRTSSFSFKGESWKIADLARELNASLIVEGTVRKADDRVRVTAQLIDPTRDKHLWSESYDREISDIFSLQQDIAQSIVTALRNEIGAQTVVGSKPTGNMEAYELFLQGRHLFYQRGPALESAIMLLQMAVDEDAEFSEAWAYLAAAAVVTGYYRTSVSKEDAIRIAAQASNKALALDPDLGLALAAQAMLAYYQRNLEKGFQLIDRAAHEYPHDTTIRLWAGMYYWYLGYLEEARTHFLYAYTRNPRVGITNGSLGLLYLAQGREDLAAPYLTKASELDYPNHHHTQASLLMMRGDFDAAFAKLKITLASPGTDSYPLPWIHGLERAGRSYIENPESKETLISVIENSPLRGVTEKARLALMFNLKDSFFEYLSLAIDEGPMWLAYLVPTLWLPEYRAYVEDPRFLEITRRDGALGLWQHRGFLDGCIPVDGPAGEHLDCSKRYQRILSQSAEETVT